ncbi:MAG: hypothetical protein LBJ64_03625 [Deltaproteobacteria bacterium]|nr:hypothetical protein [Deltaproteobacteria bacterium]
MAGVILLERLKRLDAPARNGQDLAYERACGANAPWRLCARASANTTMLRLRLAAQRFAYAATTLHNVLKEQFMLETRKI